jgi:hypothetical protein
VADNSPMYPNVFFWFNDVTVGSAAVCTNDTSALAENSVVSKIGKNWQELAGIGRNWQELAGIKVESGRENLRCW